MSFLEYLNPITAPSKIFSKGIEGLRDMFGGGDKPKRMGLTGNPLFDGLRGIPGFGEKAETVRKNAEEERAGLFQEIGGSAIRRMFPRASKWLDIGRTLTGRWAPEAHPLQNEIAGITAFTALCPDFILRPLTGFIVRSEMFQKAVEWAPMLPEEMKKEAQKAARGQEYDPDKIIEILRILNQDIGTVLTGINKIGL